MNSTRECYEALLDGKKLMMLSRGSPVALNENGELVSCEHGGLAGRRFDYPNEWSIVEEWYENIPAEGVLVKDCDQIDLITSYNEGSTHPFVGEARAYSKVTPCSKAEILKWASSAK